MYRWQPIVSGNDKEMTLPEGTGKDHIPAVVLIRPVSDFAQNC